VNAGKMSQIIPVTKLQSRIVQFLSQGGDTMKNQFCREAETVSVENGDNVIFPNIDSCTAMVFVLNTGGIEAAHHVLTEKGQDFTIEIFIKNANRLTKEVTNDIGMMGKKVSISQVIFLGNTVNWGYVDWPAILLKLRQDYDCPVTLVELKENQVDIYVFSKLKMIEVHKGGDVKQVSFSTCIDKLNLKL
jgi:hypothetical protein